MDRVPSTPPSPADRRLGDRSDHGTSAFSSMSLLLDLTTNTLDPGYRMVAGRRAAAGAASSRPRFPALAVIGLLLVGGVLAAAVLQQRDSAPAAARARQALVHDVTQREARLDALTARAGVLKRDIDRLRRSSLGSTGAGRAAAQRLTALEAAAGASTLTGPGLEITLDDASATPAPLQTPIQGEQLQAGRVQDRDLQELANALWAAGARGIAINDQRLTSLSSIRSAGDAILVDFRPVDAPYRLVAVGRTDTLAADFAASATAGRFRTYAAVYGMAFDVHELDHTTLPAAAPLDLHVATPVTGSPPTAPATLTPSGAHS